MSPERNRYLNFCGRYKFFKDWYIYAQSGTRELSEATTPKNHIKESGKNVWKLDSSGELWKLKLTVIK